MPLSGMEELFLTPAYDICPQDRTRGEVTQAMLIMGKERASQVALLLKAAPLFLINKADAIQLAIEQLKRSSSAGPPYAMKQNSARSIETFFGCANS